MLTKLSFGQDHIVSNKINAWLSILHLWHDSECENAEVLGKIYLSHCQFFDNKFYIDCPGIEPGQPSWQEMNCDKIVPLTARTNQLNHFSYCVILLSLKSHAMHWIHVAIKSVVFNLLWLRCLTENSTTPTVAPGVQMDLTHYVVRDK